MTFAELASKVRAKYPGAYDNLDDTELASKVIAKYPQYKAQIDNAEQIEPGVYGETAPPEQKAAEMVTKIGNDAGAVYGGANLLKGLAGLGMKGVGAMTEGMGPTLESWGDKIGSLIPAGWKNLPEDALRAKSVVDDATHYAMNPHPEVQQAIMDITNGAPKAATEAADIVPASESTVKELSSGTPELPAPAETAVAAPETPVSGPKAPEVAPSPTDTEVPSEMGLFDKPIFSMDNMTPLEQLKHADAQMQTVGKAIGDQLENLTQTGKLYDPAQTAKELEGMYIRNASGQIIPPGEASAQAMNNAAVNKALETLKSEAMDSDGILNKLPWERANAVKGALQRLAEDTGEQVYQHAASAVRDSIDNQAEKLLAASGDNVAPFQQLRDAYSKLAQIRGTLNSQVRSGLSAKNAVPVVRTAVGGAGIATGNPGVAAAAAGDFFGRKYGTLALARGLHNAADLPGAMTEAGNAMKAGTMAPAAKGIAAGLMADEDENK